MAQPSEQLQPSQQVASPGATPWACEESPKDTDSTVESSKTRVLPTATACMECRSRHLKCDGLFPCTRCASSGNQCRFITSRRGRRRPRKDAVSNRNKHTAIGPAMTRSEDCALTSSLTSQPISNSATNDLPTPAIPSSTPTDSRHDDPMSALMHDLFEEGGLLNSSSSCSVLTQQLEIGTQQQQHSHHLIQDRCFDAFYYFFFTSQPFVLPKEPFLHLAKETDMSLLIVTMRWIGSLYVEVSSVERDQLFQQAITKVHDAHTPRDGFMVQSLMLLTIGIDGQGQQRHARDLLADAQALALEMKMNAQSFAHTNSRGNPTLAESWRRTWWNLYVTDAMISGVHRITNFVLFDVPAQVEIPCEESEYMFGKIPLPLTLEDLLDDDFTDMDRNFSSFAYRILACRNLGQFMRTPPILSADDDKLTHLEARLTNWKLSLPLLKRDALLEDGSLDAMMFQAHMMTHATSILLHQPHSRLNTSPTENINSCAPHQGVQTLKEVFNMHTKHTVASACAISDMVTIKAPLVHVTHFFTCVVTLSSIVHLSRWAHQYRHKNDTVREHIRLNIGGLKELSQVWWAAETARDQVKAVAKDLFRAKCSQQQLLDSSFGGETSHDDIVYAFATDESLDDGQVGSLEGPDVFAGG